MRGGSHPISRSRPTTTSRSARRSLGTKLRELARPIGEHERAALINCEGVAAAISVVITRSDEPSAAELVVGRGIHAEGALLEWELLTLAPDELAASNKRVVDRAAQR